MTGADLLLHPVRLRIVQAFLGGRELTTTQLAVELEDVPAGSLYRHVALLMNAGILRVVAERRVRAVFERTYALRVFAAQVGPAEAAAMTRADHAHAFMTYVAGLLGDFDRYLAAGAPNPVRDGVRYCTSALWLTDNEYADFLRDFRVLLQPRLAHAPGNGRRRRMVSSVFLPAPQEPAG